MRISWVLDFPLAMRCFAGPALHNTCFSWKLIHVQIMATSHWIAMDSQNRPSWKRTGFLHPSKRASSSASRSVATPHSVMLAVSLEAGKPFSTHSTPLCNYQTCQDYPKLICYQAFKTHNLETGVLSVVNVDSQSHGTTTDCINLFRGTIYVYRQIA